MMTAGPAMAWQGWDSTPEPNTEYDRTSGLMWAEGDATPDDQKVYFDAYLMESLYPVPSAGPSNVAGTKMMPLLWYQNFAMLGFWVDCNDDGFIGNALTGQTVYSSTLLADETKCPISSHYNNGYEVDEFRAILRGEVGQDADDPRDANFSLVEDGDGMSPFDVSMDPNDILDPDARIWGDWSTPDKDAVPSQGIMPLPPGTVSTWNGHFKYVDDATLGDLSATVDGAAGEGTYYGIAEAMPDAYEGDYEGDSPGAYARYAWNSSSSGKGGDENCGGPGDQNDCEGAYAQPYVMAFDCKNAENGIHVPTEVDPETGETGNETMVAAPVAPGPVNTDGSIDGTTRQNTRAVLTADPGECDQGGVSVLLYDNLETASQDSNVNAEKVNADFNYFPIAGDRLRFAESTGLPDTVALPYNGYCGVSETQCWAPYASNSYWYDNHVFSRRPPRAYWGLTQSIEVTNYADITEAAAAAAGASLSAALPSEDSAAAYGGEQCGDFTGEDSSTGTWSCDPTEWDLDDSEDWWGMVGDFYDLRDEDCYDGSAFGTGLLLSCPVE